MPVHKVPGGWKWGTSGKVYKSKKGTQKQAAAIYASGWRENGKENRKQARLLKASPKAENRYIMDLTAITSAVSKNILQFAIREFGTGLHQDAPEEGDDEDEDDEDFEEPKRPKSLGLGAAMLGFISVWLIPRVGESYNRMAGDVVLKATTGLAAMGIDPMHAAGVEGFIEAARAANVELVKNASADFLAQVRATLKDFEGAPKKELVKALEERAEVYRSHAQLIGRTETLKLNSNIIEMRCRAAGVNSYRWVTAHDERVRVMHAQLEGREFTWDKPPVTNLQGEENHPGEDFNCRCVASPLAEQ